MQTTSAIRCDTDVTPQEATALNFFINTPLSHLPDSTLKTKAGIFAAEYGASKELPRASEDIFHKLMQCDHTGNWGWVTANLEHFTECLCALFERAGFDCEQLD